MRPGSESDREGDAAGDSVNRRGDPIARKDCWGERLQSLSIRVEYNRISFELNTSFEGSSKQAASKYQNIRYLLHISCLAE